MFALGLLAVGSAMFSAWWISRNMVEDFSSKNALTVLGNAVDLVGRSKAAVDELRRYALNERKRDLEAAASLVLEGLKTAGRGPQNPAVPASPLDPAALERIAKTSDAKAHAYIAFNDGGAVLAKHDPGVLGAPPERLHDAQGRPGLHTLIGRARQSPTTIIDLFFLEKSGGAASALLAAALHDPERGATVVVLESLDDFEESLKDRADLAMDELRARINEVVVGAQGYLFIMDRNCTLIAHPRMVDVSIRVLEGKASLNQCARFMEAAERPFGKNRLDYLWDRPDDINNFTYAKSAWILREPITGWYVGATIYRAELDRAVWNFTAGVSPPALIAVLLLAGASALLLRSLLKPVQSLTDACKRVGEDDLDALAPTDASGEVGLLCRRFNDMVENIAALRKKEEARRLELERVNNSLEKTVKDRTQALEGKARKLEAANARLKELDQLKSTFLSSVSHELRTPLTSILGFAKLILKDLRKVLEAQCVEDEHFAAKRARIGRNTEVIVNEGERLSRLINDFLDLSKIESGRIVWNDEVFPLRKALEASRNALNALIAARPEVDLLVRFPDEPPLVKADFDRLVQVFINLLSNAYKFTVKGRIVVAARTADGLVQVRIGDDGPGIARKDLQRIFEKFEQAASGDVVLGKPQGTGLGLAICRTIILH